MFYIIVAIIIFTLFIYALVAVPKSEYEQKMDDEAQMNYIKEYINKKNK